MSSGKDPALTIDPKNTVTLAFYSLFFCRWALAISPANYPLLLCHIFNETVQLTQLGRWYTATQELEQKQKQITQNSTQTETTQKK